jgi:hypothetical protein
LPAGRNRVRGRLGIMDEIEVLGKGIKEIIYLIMGLFDNIWTK